MEQTSRAAHQLHEELRSIKESIDAMVRYMKQFRDPIGESQGQVSETTAPVEISKGRTKESTHQLLDMIECDHFLVSTDGSRHGHPVPDAIDLIHRKHPAATIHLHDTPAVRQRAGDGDHVVYVAADCIAFEG